MRPLFFQVIALTDTGTTKKLVTESIFAYAGLFPNQIYTYTINILFAQFEQVLWKKSIMKPNVC